MPSRLTWWRAIGSLSSAGIAIPGNGTPDPLLDRTAITERPSEQSLYEWIITEEKWNLLSWNPFIVVVDYLPTEWAFQQIEGSTVVKPTWAELLEHYESKLRSRRVESANIEAKRRIAINYHPSAGIDRHKEWETRLSGIDLTEKDLERDRLRAVCKNLEERIASATTLEQVEAIEVRSDGVWAKP